MNKTAQMHMMETISVLLIFFLIIGIGIGFYGGFVKDSVIDDLSEVRQLDGISVASRVKAMPELLCSRQGIAEASTCIDIFKLDVSSAVIGTNLPFYFDLLGTSDITITQIYPTPLNWTLYDNKENRRDRLVTFVPVSLYNPINKTYGFGVIQVDLYS